MLNSKQKKQLRSLGNPLKPLFNVGKEGLSLNLISSLEDSLKAHELVKISVLKTAPNPVMELALDLASSTHSELIQVVGRSILLYKQNEKRKIHLT